MAGNYEFRDFCIQFTYYSKLYVLRVSELCLSNGVCSYLVRLNDTRGVFDVSKGEWKLVSNDPMLHRLKTRIIKELQANKVLTHMVQHLQTPHLKVG